MAKSWVPRNALSAEQLEAARTALGISHNVFVHVLWNRGIRSREQWEALVHGSDLHMHSPFLMKDMDLAVRRVIRAMQQGERILVFGDYDVDGTTAVAMMYSFLRDAGIVAEYYIPDRYMEGYGVSKKGVDYAIDNCFGLIIALDCGVRSVKLVEYARDKGVDFIICDHHIPGAQLPPAVAVLNPKQDGCNYPYKELSGCGIGFKLIQALADNLAMPASVFEKYYDLVAVSIASDLVSMTGENRELMKKGLQKLQDQPLPGFKLITSSLTEKKKISVSNVVFMIGPRINAAGRMASGNDAVRMMLAKDQATVAQFAGILNKHNQERKGIDRQITTEALDMLKNDPENDERYTTVLYNANWHKGVVGIVASRLMETYYRPTIVLTGSGEFIGGSARSVDGFNIHDALEECREYLYQFGGHYFAAGMTLHPHKLEAFREAFEAVAQSRLTRDQLVQKLHYDCEVEPIVLNLNVLRSLDKVSPFGPDNPKPMFVCRNLYDGGNSKKIGFDKSHLRLELECKKTRQMLYGVAFGMGDHLELVQTGPVDIIFHMEENHFNGNSYMQLDVQDIRRSGNKPQEKNQDGVR